MHIIIRKGSVHRVFSRSRGTSFGYTERLQIISLWHHARNRLSPCRLRHFLSEGTA